MAGGRPAFALVSLLLVAGAIILTFFVLLAGAHEKSPLNKFYFIQADTSTIPNAPAISRWTFWNICALTADGQNVGCGKVKPAFPFDPRRNFHTTLNVPDDFTHGKKYYYLTRFMFAFDLIYLFFAVMSLLTGGLALCTRIGSYFSGFLAMIAAFFSAITCALMTAAFVKGRHNFRSIGESAQVGKYNFGFMWASFACLFLASMLFCVAGGRGDTTVTYRRSRFFGRRSRSTRSRGSFKDGA